MSLYNIILLLSKTKKTAVEKTAASGESAGARTRDPNIKSVVLYRLSYGFSEPKAFAFGGAKIVNIFILPK